MKTRAKADWLSALKPPVPCGAINSLDEVFADPQVQARGMVSSPAAPAAADLPLVSSPIKLERPGAHRPPAAALGQHTDEVLGELAAWMPRLATLRDRQVI